MTSRVCLYVRPMLQASEADQLDRLHSWAAAAGHTVLAVYLEPQRKRGPDHRREATRMLADATRGHWEGVACVSLLAMARSVSHAHEVIARLESLGVGLIALDDRVNTRIDMGRAADAFALAARLEHAVHVERSTVGARRRIEAGFKHGRPRVLATTEARIVSLVRSGTSTERITRLVGCGKSTVYRIRKELSEAPS